MGLVRRGGGSEGSPVFFSGGFGETKPMSVTFFYLTGRSRAGGGAGAAAGGRGWGGDPWEEGGGRAHLKLSERRAV